jgi:hypothetical protein
MGHDTPSLKVFLPGERFAGLAADCRGVNDVRNSVSIEKRQIINGNAI